jgi:hypothetical protein
VPLLGTREIGKLFLAPQLGQPLFCLQQLGVKIRKLGD